MRKIIIGFTAIAMLSLPSTASQMLVGGNVPLVASMVGIGVLSLDFGGAGTDQTIAIFMFSCNDASFAVNWKMANGGVFKTASGTQSIAMTSVKIKEGLVSGNGGFTAGTGLGRKFDNATGAEEILGSVPGLPETTLSGAGGLNVAGTGVTWTDAQTTATYNDQILMTASWGNTSTVLYGLYTEQIIYTVTAN